MFRIKEEYLVTQWTYIKADTKEEATEKLYNEETYEEVEIDCELVQTDWESLEEVE